MSYLFTNTVSIFNSNAASITTDKRLPVDIGNASINISGNVNINTPNTVHVDSTPEDPVHNHITEIGTSGILVVPYLPIGGNVVITSGNVAISGNIAGITSNVVVSVNNFPSFPVTQNVSFSNQTVFVSGNVNANVSGNVSITSGNVSISGNIAGITGVTNTNIYQSNGSVIANTTPLPVAVQSNTTNYVYTQQAPTWSQDALGKIRTSATLNQDWYVPVVDDDTTFRWSQTLNGTNANSSFLANTSEIQMSSGNTAAGYAYRQTYSKFKIVPGTSHLVYTTVNFTANTTESGVTRRSGLFDPSNGIYWEQGGVSANTLAVVVRRTVANGSVIEDRIYANNFTTDKLDGTGPSGFNIFTNGLNKYYTFWFDFIGGRTGRIRFGMGTPTGPQICHVQSYASPGLMTNFVTDNALPLRREIFNSSTQANSPTFNMSGISFQAESPSSFNPSPTSAYNVNGYVPGTTLTPIMTIGLRAGFPFQNSDISPGEFNLVEINNQGKNSTAATFLYTVVYNANINGVPAYVGNSAVSNANTGRSSQYWTWSNTATVTGGLTILSGITQSGGTSAAFDGLPGTFNIGADINQNPATLTLCVRQLAAGGGTSNVVSSWNFIEQL